MLLYVSYPLESWNPPEICSRGYINTYYEQALMGEKKNIFLPHEPQAVEIKTSQSHKTINGKQNIQFLHEQEVASAPKV